MRDLRYSMRFALGHSRYLAVKIESSERTARYFVHDRLIDFHGDILHVPYHGEIVPLIVIEYAARLDNGGPRSFRQ